jgi:hypothetical protein
MYDQAIPQLSKNGRSEEEFWVKGLDLVETYYRNLGEPMISELNVS